MSVQDSIASDMAPGAEPILMRRDAIIAEVETLRHQRAVAALDGLQFDDATLAVAERELDRITDAEGLQAQRDREAQAQAIQAHRAALRARLAKAQKHRLAAVERAEDAARALALALTHVREHVGEIARTARQLGAQIPPNLDVGETERRLSARLTDAMTPVIGGDRKYGSALFPQCPHYARGSWREGEAKLAQMIETALEGDKA